MIYRWTRRGRIVRSVLSWALALGVVFVVGTAPPGWWMR